MKYKDSTFFKYVPTPVVLYVMCMVFATFDLWQRTDIVNAAYKVVRGNLIPAMIFVMLLRCDIRKILKLGPGRCPQWVISLLLAGVNSPYARRHSLCLKNLRI
ncbi:MAG: hypothetical protein PWP47_822 [Synergistaceae bacterium]|nr:hypothetical protein [Synergistaceae bacterium]